MPGLFRRRRTSPTLPPAAPGTPADPNALERRIDERLRLPGWTALEPRTTDRVIQPPPAAWLPPLTARAGEVAVRFRACQLAGAERVLDEAEGEAVLARVAAAWAAIDDEALRRLRAGAVTLGELHASRVTAPVGLEVVRRITERYGLDAPPIGTSDAAVPDLAAGFRAAFGHAVARGLQLQAQLDMAASSGEPVWWETAPPPAAS